MRTASAKAKGRRLQNLLAETILAHFPALSSKDVRPAQMGGAGIDIQLSEAARRVFPFAVEAKNHERMNVWGAIKQAEDNAKDEGLVPTIAISRNRLPEPYIAVPMGIWFFLVQHAGAALEAYITSRIRQCPTSTTTTDDSSTPE